MRRQVRQGYLRGQKKKCVGKRFISRFQKITCGSGAPLLGRFHFHALDLVEIGKRNRMEIKEVKVPI